MLDANDEPTVVLHWYWYASKSDGVSLHRPAYKSIEFDNKPFPFPDWACKGPNGGVHIDARVGRIDVSVSEMPPNREEFSWTYEYGVPLFKRKWFELIQPIVERNDIEVGAVYLEDELRPDWVTIHSIEPPSLLCKQIIESHCSNCGGTQTWTRGRCYFDSTIGFDREIIMNRNGLFILKSIVESMGLRTPNKCFKPTLVSNLPRKHR
jgi:hypothetical protein